MDLVFTDKIICELNNKYLQILNFVIIFLFIVYHITTVIEFHIEKP